MTQSRTFSIHASRLAASRLDAARADLGDPAHQRNVTIIGASRGAADEFARSLVSSGSTFGISRFSLTQFAARTALLTLARRGMTPSTALVGEAVATRAAFDAAHAQALSYFGPVASTPGFPRALARTLAELRNAGLDRDDLATVPLVGTDLSRLLEHFERAVHDARTVDRADLFLVAVECLKSRKTGGTVVLLDLSLVDRSERRLVEALVADSDRAIATVAPGDGTEKVLETIGGRVVSPTDEAASDLAHLRRYLFDAESQPPRRSLDGSLELFSAPGEVRECVEIARRILREAHRGVRFDEMAVLVRSPHAYFGLLEHALGRAGVPAWFDRGTRRPHPAGRAFLALLACAADRVSAVRFAEYLSLAQVPGEVAHGATWELPEDEVAWRSREHDEDELETERDEASLERPASDAPVIAGTLRAPWRWESLMVDAKVIGGSAARWRRRFEGHTRELERRLLDAGKEEGADGAESAHGLRIKSTLEQLGHLERFALPVVETLEAWTGTATWGEWLERFIGLAPRVLRRPEYVLRVLSELRPMATVGPIGLDEARRVLSDRLLTAEAEAPARRYGRVFVGTPNQARGRAFRVVFVPGLAERLFPQKPREDPLLLDNLRAPLDSTLRTESDRISVERQLLRLAAGAASDRLSVSYPRIELSEARARVPSFYALDLMRAATGEVPAHEQLEDRARKAGGASLAWPAPADPTLAIDEVEHDLAVLRRLLDEPDAPSVRGHAHYLLSVSEPLRRSIIERWRRASQDWSPVDGLTRVTPLIGEALEAHRLTRRSYSPSSLQRFSACPYQFVLASFFRLHPLEEPMPLERIDPLTRGSLIHEVQAGLMRELRDAGLLPVTPGTLAEAGRRLDRAIDDVATRAHEELAPAVERVWKDDVAGMRRDMHGWLQRMCEEHDWHPKYFEFGFGPVPGDRDPASSPDPVVLEGGFSLRGAIDLIEEHRDSRALRVTDYKTGRAPDKLETLKISGGTVLQPVMYALAAEQALGRGVTEGRLFYCTTAGGFRSHSIPLDEDARRAAREVLQVIDRAVAGGGLFAAPAEGACDRCDFRSVCGPDVARRTNQKKQAPLADLHELRSRR